MTVVRNGDRLDDGDAILGEEAIDRLEVPGEIAVAHRLQHLDRHDPIVRRPLRGQVPVVDEADLHPVREALPLDPLPGPEGLLGREGDTRDTRPELPGGETGERAPAAADLEDVVARADPRLRRDPPELAPLGLLERFASRLEERTGVRHGRVEEEAVEVVSRGRSAPGCSAATRPACSGSGRGEGGRRRWPRASATSRGRRGRRWRRRAGRGPAGRPSTTRLRGTPRRLRGRLRGRARAAACQECASRRIGRAPSRPKRLVVPSGSVRTTAPPSSPSRARRTSRVAMRSRAPGAELSEARVSEGVSNDVTRLSSSGSVRPGGSVRVKTGTPSSQSFNASQWIQAMTRAASQSRSFSLTGRSPGPMSSLSQSASSPRPLCRKRPTSASIRGSSSRSR